MFSFVLCTNSKFPLPELRRRFCFESYVLLWKLFVGVCIVVEQAEEAAFFLFLFCVMETVCYVLLPHALLSSLLAMIADKQQKLVWVRLTSK